MEKKINIGLVIADGDEFLPLEKMMPKLGGEELSVAGRRAYTFSVGNCAATAVHCGIGKVNAAVAATALAEKGADMLLNIGLSGGISGVRRGELIIPERFLEHDFDLTGIGYKPCEKPGQEYIYFANKALSEKLSFVTGARIFGTAVCGDCFVSDNNLRDFLKEQFSATTCDMETAAVAYVASSYKIPYASLRKVSDDAGDDAAGDYRELNEKAENELVLAVISLMEEISK
jgi:adenosylhomocysteine nucleosidase